MKETTQQYRKRILSLLRGRKPLAILASTPRQVAGLVKGVPKKRLAARPAKGAWSAVEILAHLADSELVQGFRLRLILGSNGTPIQAFDQDVWAEYSSYAKHDPALSLESFRVNRERTLRLLKSVPRRLLSNYGVHSERGKETMKRVLEMMAGHDINHVEQLRRLLRNARS